MNNDSNVENSDPLIRILQRNLKYDPMTGNMTWRVSKKNGVKIGDEAGSIMKSDGKRTSYRKVTICGETLLAHRIAWALHYGKWPKGEIDHEDGNGLNISIGNLRDVTPTVNKQNSRMYASNTSGFTGVYWDKHRRKWQVEIKVSGKKVYLGRFATIEQASAAYENAKVLHEFHQLHGTVK